MDEREARLLGAAQDELRGDLHVLQDYGSTIPEVWTGFRFEGPNLVALLTDPDRHRDRILALVAHPHRVDVRSAPHSRRELDAVYEQVVSLIGSQPHRWTGHGPGLERVHVALRANEDTLAAELHARFGDALEIQLGRHRYPLNAASIDRPQAPQPSIEIPDLVLATEIEREDWYPGETIGGLLRLTNTSATETLRLGTGSPAIGVLLDATGSGIVGGYSGWIAGVGRLLELGPAAMDAIDFLAGSDTLDSSLGAVLPPGDYLLVVRLPVSSPAGDGVLVTSPVEVTLRRP